MQGLAGHECGCVTGETDGCTDSLPGKSTDYRSCCMCEYIFIFICVYLFIFIFLLWLNVLPTVKKTYLQRETAHSATSYCWISCSKCHFTGSYIRGCYWKLTSVTSNFYFMLSSGYLVDLSISFKSCLHWFSALTSISKPDLDWWLFDKLYLSTAKRSSRLNRW